MRFLAMTIIVGMISACGSSSEIDGGNVSRTHFITVGPGVSGLVAKVKRPRLRACLSGAPANERDQWVENVQKSILAWIDPLRRLTADPLTKAVDVVDRGSCDTEIQIAPNTHAHTLIGQRPIIRMGNQGYFASYNVLLHEFGHGFALGDTYQGGLSGNCRPGQPQAVMCNTSFSTPQPDDIAGITQIFKRVFPRDEPPRDPPEGEKIKLYAALGNNLGDERYHLYVAPDGGEVSSTAELAFCAGSRADCEASGSAWKVLKKDERFGARNVYRTVDELNLLDGFRVVLRYVSETELTYQTLSFEHQS